MRNEDTVKLISKESFEIFSEKNAAMVSQILRNMLTSPVERRLSSIEPEMTLELMMDADYLNT